MVENGIRGVSIMSSTRYEKANNKYMENLMKIYPQNTILIWMQIIYMDGPCQNHFQLIILNG